MIDQGGISGGGFKAPLEGTPAHTVIAGQIVIIKGLIEIIFDPLLDRQNPVVAVIFLKLEMA